MSIISAIAADEVEKCREPLIQAMAGSIARSGKCVATERHTMAASTLLDATLATLREETPLEPTLAGSIDRRQVAHFGDALPAVLKDVIGHDLPPSAFSCVGDAYWRMINSCGVPMGQ